MKKLLIILLLPTLVLGAFVISQVNASNINENDIQLGNGLSNTDFNLNSYIETEEKEQVEYDIEIPSSFRNVPVDDEYLELYLEEETLAIAVRDTRNGYVYSSYNISPESIARINALNEAAKSPILSGVSLDLFVQDSPVTVSYLDTVGGVEAARATISDIDNGFKAAVNFNHPSIQIKFDLLVTIEEGTLVVNIPSDTVVEYNPNLWDNSIDDPYYLLRNITVFQYFGSTISEEDGYVVVPDGSGALISLEPDPESKTTLILDVYGEDKGYMSVFSRDRAYTLKETKRLTLPVYGVVHDTGNTGFYTVIESGAPYAQFTFRSAGNINAFYSTYFNFRYRQSYEQFQSRSNEDQYRISYQDYPNDYDATLRYVFVSGSEADYVGIAKSYKEYLVENNSYPEVNTKNYAQVPTKIDFIGTEITTGLLSNTITEITKYDEIVDLLTLLQDEGYGELLTSLKTFNRAEMGYRFDIYRQMGGKSDFNDMLAFLDAQNIEFTYYLDYIRSNKDYSREHAQTLSKREIYYIDISTMYFGHLVNDPSEFLGYAENDVDAFTSYGIDNVAIASLDRAVFTSWDDEVIYAQTNQSEIKEMLEYYETNNISTALYNPDAYLYKYMSEYYDAPISSSEYTFISGSIPFVQLVLSGTVDMYTESLNFASDEEFTLMRMVEFGVYPSYVLTGGSAYDLKETNSSNIYISEYSILQNRMSTYKDFYEEGLSSIMQKEMIDHTFLSAGVVLVEYNDGTQILLNYNNDAITVETITVDPMSYVVIS